MKTIISWLMFVTVLGGAGDPVAAQEADSVDVEAAALGLTAPENTGGGVVLTSSPESLRGLKAVCLAVQDPNPELEANGLTRQRIYLHVALALVRAGISVVSPEEYRPGEGTPLLNVYIQALNTNGLAFAYNLGLSLSQDVSLARDPETTVAGSTWRSEELGVVPAGRVRDLHESFRTKADEFVADYQAANP
jgi:hypothetical protein